MLRRTLLVYTALTLLMLPLELRAQNGSSDPATSTAPGHNAVASDANSAESPAKKIWTNDDFNGPQDDTAVSKVAKQKPVAAPSRQKVLPTGRNAKWYSDQIAMLQRRIPLLDAQIAELQSALEGKPMGDGKSSQRPRFVKQDDWSNELRQLQTQRADILSRISALEDDARHNGIPNSALP